MASQKISRKGWAWSDEPMLIDPAASHSGRVSRALSKAVGTGETSKFTTLRVLENFEVIRAEIEKKTGPDLADKDIKKELDQMMGNYAPKDHCVMTGDRLYGFFCANWQAECLSKSTHLFLDICYIKNSELPSWQRRKFLKVRKLSIMLCK